MSNSLKLVQPELLYEVVQPTTARGALRPGGQQPWQPHPLTLHTGRQYHSLPCSPHTTKVRQLLYIVLSVEAGTGLPKRRQEREVTVGPSQSVGGIERHDSGTNGCARGFTEESCFPHHSRTQPGGLEPQYQPIHSRKNWLTSTM